MTGVSGGHSMSFVRDEDIECACKDTVPLNPNNGRTFLPKSVGGPIIRIHGYCYDANYLADLLSQRHVETGSFYNVDIVTGKELSHKLRRAIFKVAGRTDPMRGCSKPALYRARVSTLERSMLQLE